MIILPVDMLAARGGQSCRFQIPFRRLDDGDVYSAIASAQSTEVVSGTIIVGNVEAFDSDVMDSVEDDVVVFAEPSEMTDDGLTVWSVSGAVRTNGHWTPIPVEKVPVREQLFSRTEGLLETDIIADRQVLVVGVGSVGSIVTSELTKLGVMRLGLMDPDRLEVANVMRHVAGLADVGRLKVLAMRDAVLNVNPYASIETHDFSADWDRIDIIESLVSDSDLVICAADDEDARSLCNHLCIASGTPMILAGAFERAHGGQVLAVRADGRGPCYQCFLQGITGQGAESGRSSLAGTGRVAYADRPVTAEPGLSNDISPISQMVVKLSLQHLLQGRRTSLASLDEDLAPPLWQFVNRREGQFRQLEPLGANLNGMRIMRWYGVEFPRNEACAVCGDMVGEYCQSEDIQMSDADMAAFSDETRGG